MEEEGETIQFYKIQVMEKDRQISNFQAKMKKTELKHNREIKEAKNAQERAKTLLKEEKTKLDKLVIQAKENQQQNTLLQMRLTELQDSKDKEVAEVRSQFNSIKDKTRTSEHILPTQTFLNDIGKQIEQLPIYEDIYVNLKEKVTQYEQLKLKYDDQKTKLQESLKSSKHNEEIMKLKVEDLDKTLKHLLPKLKDKQQIITNLLKQKQDLNTNISKIQNDLQQQQSAVSYLQNQLKDTQLHIEQLNHSLVLKQQTAQQQIRTTQQQIHIYEQEIENLHIKDNQNLSQISILEQQIHSIQNTLITERNKLEEVQQQTNEQIENIKQQWRKQKTETEELQSKYSEKVDDLIRVSLANEKHQEKIKSLEKFTEQIWEESTMRKATQVESKSRIKQLQSNNLTLIETNQSLCNKIDCLQKDNLALVNQLHQANQKSKQLVFIHPNHEQLPKKQNSQVKAQLEAQLALKQLALKQIRQEITLTTFKNSQLQQSLQQNEKKIASYITKIEQLYSKNNHHQSTIKQNQSIIKLNQSTIKLYQSTIKQHSSTLKLQENTIKQQTKQIELITNQNKLNLKQLLQLKQNISAMVNKNKNDETTINSLTAKNDLLQFQLDTIKKETLINNQTIKGHKEEIKNMREANSTLIERYTKETRDLNNQINLLKHQKEKSKLEFTNKEKQFVQDITLLKNDKNKEGKLNQQIDTLKAEILLLQSNKIDLQKSILQHSRINEDLNKKITILQESNFQKQRELQIMSLSLQRQRRERSLRAVPSLQSLQDQQAIQKQNFNDMYLLVTQKEGCINLLQREVSDLKQEIQGLRLSQNIKLEALQAEQNQHIQTLIALKIKMAQTEMRASEKEYLYSQIKKKMAKLTTQQ